MTSFGNSSRALKPESVWSPNLLFFRKGCTKVTIPSYGEVTITWKFQSSSSVKLPFNYIHCQLFAFGRTFYGQGYAFSLKAAMRQAFAESWERCWLFLFKKSSNREVGLPSSSNGFAAGATDAQSIASASNELMERAIVLNAWQSMRGWKPYAVEGFWANLMRRRLLSAGWKVEVYKLTDKNLGSVLACLARHKNKGAVFDSIFLSPTHDDKASEATLLRAICRGIKASKAFDVGADSFAFPAVGGPEDQALFYSNPANDEAFLFLNDPSSSVEAPELPNPIGILSQLLFSKSEMPAVAFSSHAEWPELFWGLKSIAGRNPWPHPLA